MKNRKRVAMSLLKIAKEILSKSKVEDILDKEFDIKTERSSMGSNTDKYLIDAPSLQAVAGVLSKNKYKVSKNKSNEIMLKGEGKLIIIRKNSGKYPVKVFVSELASSDLGIAASKREK